MLITLSRRTVICLSFAEVYLTSVAPLGAVSTDLIFLNNESNQSWIYHLIFIDYKNGVWSNLIALTLIELKFSQTYVK